MAIIFAIAVKGLESNIELLQDKNVNDDLPLDLSKGQSVSPLLLQYDYTTGTDPGAFVGHSSWGLLGHLGETADNYDSTSDGVSGVTSFDMGFHCGKPLLSIIIFNNQSTDISALGGVAYTRKLLGSSIQLDHYSPCESLHARILLGRYGAGAVTLYTSLHTAMIQDCYDDLYFGTAYQPLKFRVYALPRKLDFDDIMVVSMIFVLALTILNPLFSFPNLLDSSVAARVEGRKLIMHNNGLRPFFFHLAHYIVLFVFTITSLLMGWVLSLIGGVKWTTVNPALPLIIFPVVAFELAVLVFSMSMLFKTREGFRNNFPIYMIGLLYAPSFIMSFAGSSIPPFINVLLCIFPSTLLTKLYTIMEYYAFYSQGRFSLADLREAFLEKNLLWYTFFTLLYGILMALLVLIFDKPYKHNLKKNKAHLRLLDTKLTSQREYATTVSKGSPFMLNVIKESEAVERELEVSQFHSLEEAQGRIVIHNLGKVYQIDGKRCQKNTPFIYALKGVDLLLTMSQEENIICVVGPNGCGKSTLFKSIIMLHSYTHGDVYVNGRSVLHSSADGRTKIAGSLGLCLQDDGILYDTLTVRENLLCYHKIAMLNTVNRQRQQQNEWSIYDQVIKHDFLGLQQHLNKKVCTLSGGWKRRLSVACSLCNNPSILLLDEPTSGLDITARMELWAAIHTLAQDRTIIVSTHSLEDADTYCKKLVFMYEGRIVCTGKPLEIKLMNHGRILITIKYPIEETQAAIILDRELRKSTEASSNETGIDQILRSRIQYYNVMASEISLATLFARLISEKESGSIADFTIAQPSLDQTYLSLMKSARDHFNTMM